MEKLNNIAHYAPKSVKNTAHPYQECAVIAILSLIIC